MRRYLNRFTGCFFAFMIASCGNAGPISGGKTVLVICESSAPKIVTSQNLCTLFTARLQETLGVETASDPDTTYGASVTLMVHSMSPRAVSASLLLDDGSAQRTVGPIGMMVSDGILQNDRIVRLFDDLASDI